MPRPHKWRKVCGLPESDSFGPQTDSLRSKKTIVMSVEEYETIRLIDVEGLNQEACAKQMDVARTTVQKIYNDARKKVGETLVYGYKLKIEGGKYQLCEGVEALAGCGRCRRRRHGNKESLL
ncbi:DUF134 domain-containing protein [Tindallia californiensis]|uniref:UPF0251 protein SAMN05192546_104105 n=1 Tax=Tindallia californiensis TaxID=159292 RepID=A0A1H3MEG8_9FIRM|nr:DUF134 domain-containing protein [Tindallia californiensis]SDY75070.1 Predicted DNA-binding protein, UPF0251 family [Tindallia californiensis]